MHPSEYRGPSLIEGVALVTGAGSGIGKAIAQAYAEAGSTVICVDVDAEAAQSTAASIGSERVKTPAAFHCDVTSEASVARLGESVAESHGAVDVVLNVAGIFDGYTPSETLDLDLWNRVIAVNLTGQFLVSKQFLPGMAKKGAGAVINMASVCGLVGGTGGVAYTASKHGVIGLTRQLAVEWGPRGIRVNAICPGVIAAGMTLPNLDSGGVADEYTGIPSRRLGTAEEVASLAVYLGTSGADFIQGAAISMDGGWTTI